MNDARDQGKVDGWTQEQYSQALDKIIKNERAALRTGDRILNKNHRTGAMDK